MRQTTATDTHLVRPLIFDPSAPDEREALQEQRDTGKVWATHDTLDEQITGLLQARNPSLGAAPDAAFNAQREALLAGVPRDEFGRWVLYPWSGQLVRLLPPGAFRELRLDRNRNKITREEQAHLRSLVVGVVGLSVGNAVALNLALEGICGHLVLADFDTLELSNMNRIRAATHALGLPKTVLAARQIAEVDPFLPVTLHTEGLHPANLADFFDGPPALDVVVDECDSIDVKFLLREAARKRRVPVVMDTSDRSLLDIERFDLEPARALFHGRVREHAASELQSMSNDERLYCLLEMVGDGLSTGMAASLLEIDTTLATWPQLASDVLLGGASVTHAVRKIGLGLPLPSGRRVLDLDASLQRIEPDASRGDHPGDEGDRDGQASRPEVRLPERLRAILAEATAAPSGGNAQPWRFEVCGERIGVVLETSRETGLLDVASIASRLALGATVDILCIGAAARGIEAHVEWRPDAMRAELLATVELRATDTPPDPALASLHPLICARHTRRTIAPSKPLTSSERDQIDAASAPYAAPLIWLSDPDVLTELGGLFGDAERLRALNPHLNADLAREIRFAPADQVREGISIDTVEASALEEIAYKLLFRRDVRDRVKATGAGRRLTERTRAEFENSSAVAILRVDTAEPHEVLRAGRAMHRAWLAAEGLGLGFQPVGTLSFMLRLLDEPLHDIFDSSERDALRAIRQRTYAIEPSLEDAVFMFRLHRGPRASARSLRLPVEQVTDLLPPSAH